MCVEFSDNVVEQRKPESEDSEWRFIYGVEPVVAQISHFDVINYNNLQWIDWWDQVLLYYIAKNDFTTHQFQKQLYDRAYPISDILKEDFLRDIITYNPELKQKLFDYVDTINLERLISERKVEIKEGHYTNGEHFFYARSNKYRDSFLNRFLFIADSCSDGFSYCTTSVYARYNKDEFTKRLNKDIDESSKRAITDYSKEKHLEFLIGQCKRIQRAYEEAKRDTFYEAKSKLGFTLD